jgi:hypothetical protein
MRRFAIALILAAVLAGGLADIAARRSGFHRVAVQSTSERPFHRPSPWKQGRQKSPFRVPRTLHSSSKPPLRDTPVLARGSLMAAWPLRRKDWRRGRRRRGGGAVVGRLARDRPPDRHSPSFVPGRRHDGVSRPRSRTELVAPAEHRLPDRWLAQLLARIPEARTAKANPGCVRGTARTANGVTGLRADELAELAARFSDQSSGRAG